MQPFKVASITTEIFVNIFLMKEYNGEKAIISLTSWKSRILTVSKTLVNLIGMCPGFHIVLCLSEDEFLKNEAELPTNLKAIADCNLIEILWVRKNYKAFKKILFTMNKYQDVPIISADDDCLYQINYAEKLYQKWLEDKRYNFVSFKYSETQQYCSGCATLYKPNLFNNLYLILNDEIISTNEDDVFYWNFLKKYNLTYGYFFYDFPIIGHDRINPLSLLRKNSNNIQKYTKIYHKYI